MAKLTQFKPGETGGRISTAPLRSFVSSYFKAQGYTDKQIQDYWSSLDESMQQAFEQDVAQAIRTNQGLQLPEPGVPWRTVTTEEIRIGGEPGGVLFSQTVPIIFTPEETLPPTGDFPQETIPSEQALLFPSGTPGTPTSISQTTSLFQPVPSIQTTTTFPRTREEVIAENIRAAAGTTTGFAPPEQRLFEDAAARELKERQAAIDAYLKREEEQAPQVASLFRELARPEIERTLFKAREALGGTRGLGSGGFEGSGAVQELALRGSKELEERASLMALENLLEARQRAGLLGLEAAEVPSQFRRAALQRRLGLSDIAREQAFQKELAELTGQFTQEAARAGRPRLEDYLFGTISSTIPALAYSFAS